MQRAAGWIGGIAVVLAAGPALAGGFDWINGFNRQLGIGWSDGYHAGSRRAAVEPDWESYPAHSMPATRQAPVPAIKPAPQPSPSAAQPSPWSPFGFFRGYSTEPIEIPAPARSYPATAQRVAIAPRAPQRAPALPVIIEGPAPPARSPIAGDPYVTQPPAVAAPSAPRYDQVPAGFGGFYPEEMPLP